MSAVVAFPRQKKCGTKRRSGPLAHVLSLPCGNSTKELVLQWQWLFDGHSRWDVEEHRIPTHGPAREALAASAGNRLVDALAEPQHRDLMVEQIKMFRENVMWRAEVKSWLRSIGATEREIRSQDAALDFLYKRFRGRASA